LKTEERRDYPDLLTTSGNLNRHIVSLAWPVFVQNIARSLAIAILDSYWVGKLSSEHLAALTVGTFLSWGAFALGELIPIGTNSLVSQAVGARQKDSARHIGTLNLINAVITSAVISLVIIPVLPALYLFTNLDPPKSALADSYLYPILILLPCLVLFETGSAVFRGNGDTRTPFRLLLIVFTLKIILTPLLIFTFGLGLSGASVATMVSYGSVFLLMLYILMKKSYVYTDRYKTYTAIKQNSYNFKITLKTIKIGAPLSFEGLAFSFIYVFVSRYVADFGTTGLAALGIGHRSEAIPYQIGEAFAVTASIIVGQNLGAGNIIRAEKAAWKILFISWIPVSVYGAVLFFFPSEVASIFTDDPDVIYAASIYNMIAAFGIFFSMSEQIFMGAFAGAGNSLPPLAIYLPLTILRIPLCALLSEPFGISGIWYAIFASTILKGILIAFWWRLGRWKSRRFELGIKTPILIDSPVDKYDIH